MDGVAGKRYAALLKRKMGHTDRSNWSYDHIIIVTYGRSGSTLLQGILNTIDGVTIRGENDNIFFDFFKAYKKLVRHSKKHSGAVLPNQAWFGISFYDPARLLDHFRAIANDLLIGNSKTPVNSKMCLGFKEIRFADTGEEFEEYLDFLNQLFPKAALIFNTRSIEEVIKSGWWKDQNPNDIRPQIEELEKKFDGYQAKHDNTFKITYQEARINGKSLQDLFCFLGADYDADAVDTVLSVRHSYNPSRSDIQDLYQVPKKALLKKIREAK